MMYVIHHIHRQSVDIFLFPPIADEVEERYSATKGRFFVFGTIGLDYRIILLVTGIGIFVILLGWGIGYTIALKKMVRVNRLTANRDPLTGLWSRHAFLQHLSNRLEGAGSSRSFAVAILNINRFRWVNDALGLELGDLIIKIVAQHIRSSVGEHDHAIARLNGDEFAVILEGDIGSLEQTVADIVKHFEETPIILRGKHIHIIASAGLAGYPEHGTTAGELLSHADTALSTARRTYSGLVVFESFMDQELHDQFRLATEMRFAIEHNELSLAFQPRVDLATGKIAAVEALLRWTHPQMGPISPARFIPIAEQTGAIVPIGSWVLETACEQAVRWDWAGMEECRISINISVQQLLYPGFTEVLDGVLQRTGLHPKKLELELTESIFIENTKKISDVLGEVKRRGIRIAIDDFGKGYSSLSYLKSYPADTLKIDKDFITETLSRNGQIITESVIQLARRLGLTVVAEGVEESEQLEFLMARGCDEVQGYLLCRPIPAEECERFLRRFSLDATIDSFRERQMSTASDNILKAHAR